MATVLWGNAFGRIDAPYLPARRHNALRVEARVILALYALVALSFLAGPRALWLWLVPVTLAQPVLRLFLLAEHGRCPPVANMLANSRTTFTNRAVCRLAWNMSYHAEHHSFPNVPFFLLPELHKDLQPHLHNTSSGYGYFACDYTRDL